MKKKLHKKALKKMHKARPRFPILAVGFAAISTFVLLISGIFLFKGQSAFCANSITCISDLSGKPTNRTSGMIMGKKIGVPKDIFADLHRLTPQPPVLGATTPDQKQIYVDLTNQHLYAFDGSQMVYNFPVSTGWWNFTPTGVFHIWVKLQATTMAGGSGADAYDLPNVPWTMYFTNDTNITKADGYALHGAYWNPPFGHPYSHGCVNILPAEAEELYNWADPATQGFSTLATTATPGTRITIYGTTPNDPPY